MRSSSLIVVEGGWPGAQTENALRTANIVEGSLGQKLVCDQASSCGSFKLELLMPNWVKVMVSIH